MFLSGLGQGLGRRPTVLQSKRIRLLKQRQRHSGSITHSFNQSVNQPVDSSGPGAFQHQPGPWAQGDPLTRQTANQTSSTAPTSNAARVRTIVSRCRGRLDQPAYPHLQIRSINGPTSVPSSPPLRAGAVAPLAPLKWISSITLVPWTLPPRFSRGPPYLINAMGRLGNRSEPSEYATVGSSGAPVHLSQTADA